MLEVVDQRGHAIEVRCNKCREFKVLTKVDLERIIQAKGPDYSLFNRRCRCKLTPDCPGWNSFRYQRGPWAYGLYDEKTEMRWFLND